MDSTLLIMVLIVLFINIAYFTYPRSAKKRGTKLKIRSEDVLIRLGKDVAKDKFPATKPNHILTIDELCTLTIEQLITLLAGKYEYKICSELTGTVLFSIFSTSFANEVMDRKYAIYSETADYWIDAIINQDSGITISFPKTTTLLAKLTKLRSISNEYVCGTLEIIQRMVELDPEGRDIEELCHDHLIALIKV